MKAMILAAGRGERMRPMTDTVPKALVAVGGKPLIVRQIEKLVRAGCNELVINHAHLGASIEAALGDGRQFGATIRYSREGEALETAGGIAYALHLLGDGAFIVANADVYSDFDFAGLTVIADQLDARRRAAHLVLVPNPAHHPAGDFALHEGQVMREGARYTFSGIAAYHPALFESIVPGTKARLGALLIEAATGGRVSGELYNGRWCDVGTPERLNALERELAAR